MVMPKMKAPKGSLVYQASRATFADAVWAVSTLFIMFFLTLAYMVLVPWMVYRILVDGSLVLTAVAAFLVFTAVWPARYWAWFAQCRMLESWRRWHELRVWRDGPQQQQQFDRNTNVLLAMVPHGLFPLGLPMLSAIQAQVFPEFTTDKSEPNGVRTVVANAVLHVPLLGLMLRWLNCTYATRTHLEECLATGNALVVPDGIAGMYHSDCTEERVYLAQRHGFVRAALEQGSLLVPCFWFGHSQLWAVWPKHDSWLAALSRQLRFSLVWFWGAWWMPPLPQRVPLTLVVGRGIACPKTQEPTRAQIEAVHAQFTEELKQLYYQYRSVAHGWDPKKPLLIV